MNTRPKVSVVIPCYNAEHYVGEAIDLLLQQTYPNVEIIVVDDGSTDNSLEVIRSYGMQIRYVTGSNRGATAARNLGLTLSDGKYVLFHDADDLLAIDTIAVLVDALSGTEHAIATCRFRHVIVLNGKFIEGPLRMDYSEDIVRDLLQSTAWLLPHSILWPTKVIQELGGWDELLKGGDDIELALRALINGVQLIRVEGGCAYYREHRTATRLSSISDCNGLKSRLRVLEKTEALLYKSDKLTKYKIILGQAYYRLSTAAVRTCPELVEHTMKQAYRLAKHKALTGSVPNRVFTALVGPARKEWLAARLARVGLARKERRQDVTLPEHLIEDFPNHVAELKNMFEQLKK